VGAKTLTDEYTALHAHQPTSTPTHQHTSTPKHHYTSTEAFQ